MRGKFLMFGSETEKVYGYLKNENDEHMVILPECAMTMRTSVVMKPVFENMPPISVMADFLSYWDRNGAIDNAGELVLELYHEFAEYLSSINDPQGLVAKAYGCYGGYNSFPCDWYASRDCLLRLLEVDYKPFYADTLGYIYYYGRCNNGVPEYQEAYKYFSMAAFAGNYESSYKIADMFFNGYYVQRDVPTAVEIIHRLYDENLPFIMRGEFMSAFADIALRMGTMLRSVLDMKDGGNVREVYRYLLQAEFAIRVRIMTYDQNYGDGKVLRNIQKQLKEVRDICHALPDWGEDYYFSMGLIRLSMPHGIIKLEISHAEDVVLKFSTTEDEAEHIRPRFLLTLPDEEYCGLCDEIVMTAVPPCGQLPQGEYLFDQIIDDDLYYCGKHVLKLNCGFKLAAPEIENERVYRMISVRFAANGKLCDYFSKDHDIAAGETVLVPTENGMQRVRVEKAFDCMESELAQPVESYQFAEPADKG